MICYDGRNPGSADRWATSHYFVWVSTILLVVQDFAGPSTVGGSSQVKAPPPAPVCAPDSGDILSNVTPGADLRVSVFPECYNNVI